MNNQDRYYAGPRKGWHGGLHLAAGDTSVTLCLR